MAQSGLLLSYFLPLSGCDEASVDPTTTRVGTDIFYLIVTQHIYINFMDDCITLVCFNTMYVTLTTRQSVFVKQDMIYTIYPVGGHP